MVITYCNILLHDMTKQDDKKQEIIGTLKDKINPETEGL